VPSDNYGCHMTTTGRGRGRRTPTVDPLDAARSYVAGYADELAATGTADAALAALADLERAVSKARERIVVDLVLTHGWTYGQVGRALGITRQGALKRYADEVQATMHRNLRGRATG